MENERVIERFLLVRPDRYPDVFGGFDGSGCGAAGDGSSYGDGYGSGFCAGEGYRSGSGDGSAYGAGLSRGYGFGGGLGSGECSYEGKSDGYSSGYGIKEINGQRVYMVDDILTIIHQVRGNYAKGAILNDDFTISHCYIARVGDSFAHGATLHDAVHDAEQKALDDMPLEERIEKFVETFPDPDKAVPFAQLYEWHHTLTGSCKMGRDTFTAGHSIDTSKDYTPRYFIELTANAYGGEAIRQLAERYGLSDIDTKN